LLGLKKDKNENLKSYFSGGIGGLLSKLGRFTAKRLEQKGSKRRG